MRYLKQQLDIADGLLKGRGKDSLEQQQIEEIRREVRRLQDYLDEFTIIDPAIEDSLGIIAMRVNALLGGEDIGHLDTIPPESG